MVVEGSTALVTADGRSETESLMLSERGSQSPLAPSRSTSGATADETYPFASSSAVMVSRHGPTLQLFGLVPAATHSGDFADVQRRSRAPVDSSPPLRPSLDGHPLIDGRCPAQPAGPDLATRQPAPAREAAQRPAPDVSAVPRPNLQTAPRLSASLIPGSRSWDESRAPSPSVQIIALL